MNRSNTFRPTVENLEGRAMMSATLAAPMPEPMELVVKMKDVLVSSYQTGGSASHALYQDIFIPGDSTGTHGTGGGGGAGKVSMNDISFIPAADSGRGGEIHIESFSWGATNDPVQKVRETPATTQAADDAASSLGSSMGF